MSQRNLSGDRDEIRRFTEALFRYADRHIMGDIAAVRQAFPEAIPDIVDDGEGV